ncbi:MTH [Mytilus coruscus]|uniref:MTH n=1 Tax=Mytilus coruscus TaxID=42192 RepID=A0A6J8CEH0_MYTCO|nr:MTH [Mytilus coruscus]
MILSFPDLDYIYNQYAATCGIQFCNATGFSLTYYDRDLTYINSVCPPCYCDTCVLNKDCCPDLALPKYNEICTNDAVYNPETLLSKFYFSMINTCPNGTDKKLTQLCENDTNLATDLSLVPVTSVSRTTYRNIHCAQCHNETDTESWTVDINCEKFADFNFLSSFEEIADMVKEKRCTVRYVQQNENYKARKCQPINENLIGRCNITGTWQKYDYNIDWACHFLQLPFDIYKSVFCLLCNPPLKDSNFTVISSCIPSEERLFKSKSLDEACMVYNTTAVTVPFKNTFCYFCNRQNDLYRYAEIEGSLSVFFGETNEQIRYRISNVNFKTDFLGKYLTSYINRSGIDVNEGKRINTSFVYFDNDRQVNMSNLMSLYSQTYGPELCGIYNSNQEQLTGNQSLQCSCIANCSLNRDCCIDYEFDQHLGCSGGNVISSMCRYADKRLNSYCYERGALIYDLPVSKNDTKNHFSNIFCAICADDSVNIHPLHAMTAAQFFQPWDIEITCLATKSIPIYFQLSVATILANAYQRNCGVIYKPNPNKEVICDDTVNTIKSCNVSGTWPDFDEDVVWACEKLNTTYLQSYRGYKNIFCTLCNPDLGFQPSTTPMPTEATTTSPHGNIICSACIYAGGVVTTFRTLFLLPTDTEMTITDCKSGQVLDNLNNKCRNITCSPGYVLDNATCTPLLLVTKQLGYILPIKIECIINLMAYDEILENIENELEYFIKDYLTLEKKLDLVSLNMVTNISCDTNETVGVEILANVEFFIDESVFRKDIETKLVYLKEEIVNISNDALHISLKINLDQKAMNTKATINNAAQFTGMCYLSKTNSKVERSHRSYIYSHVTELLLCQQVNLEKDEIIIDSTVSSFIILKSTNIKIPQGKFKLTASGGARICVDTVKSLKKPEIGINNVFNTAFSTINTPHDAHHEKRTMLLYCLYSYCTPAAIILINITITLSQSYDIGYGKRETICFLKYSTSVIVCLIIPVAVICGCNIIFFLMTMRKISMTPKMERSSTNKATRHNSVIYIKLFSLTGITWFLQIIDAFLSMTHLSVIISLFNALQGVYIFLSYICNSRVANMYKKLCFMYTEDLESNATKCTNISTFPTEKHLKYLPNSSSALENTVL